MRIVFRESDTYSVTSLLAAAFGAGAIFPTAVGTEWRYDVEVLGSKGSLIQRIEESKAGPQGTELVISSKTSLVGQVITGSERIIVGECAIYRLSGPFGTFEPSLCVASSETMWQWSGRLGDKDSASASGRWVAVKRMRVPAGEFVTTVSEIALIAGAMTTVSRYWLANGVGWVRMEHELPGGTLIAELIEFRPIPRAGNKLFPGAGNKLFPSAGNKLFPAADKRLARCRQAACPMPTSGLPDADKRLARFRQAPHRMPISAPSDGDTSGACSRPQPQTASNQHGSHAIIIN